MADGTNDLTFETLTDPQQLMQLAEEWDDLWSRTAQRQFSHRFVWFRLGWDTTGRPRGRRLHVLVGRERGRVVLIWPLTLRRRLLWWQAAALGPEFTEYDPILVEDRTDAPALIAAARDHLRHGCPAALIAVQHVRAGSAADTALAADRACQVGETLASPYTTWEGYPTWEAFWQSRSRNARSNYTRRWRKFTELGTVTFGEVTDPAERRPLLRWTLARKLEWMARTGLDNDFIRTPEFAAFLDAMVAVEDAGGAMVLSALKLDGQVVATKLGTLDARRYEGFISAQDPALANWSVGTIVTVEMFKWLFARGLKYDFRIGDEPYKRDWATHDRPATSYTLINRPAGQCLLAAERMLAAARRLRETVRTRLPQPLRRVLKACLRR